MHKELYRKWIQLKDKMVIGEMIIVEQYLRILEFQLFSEIQVLDHIIYVGLCWQEHNPT